MSDKVLHFTEEERKFALQFAQAGKDSPIEDDCEQEDPRAKRNRFLAQDMLDFEECINMIGVATRIDENVFRNFWETIRDVGTLLANNPTLLDDLEGKNFKVGSDEHVKFLSKYNFAGVMSIACIEGGTVSG